jgi:hypothetical protein
VKRLTLISLTLACAPGCGDDAGGRESLTISGTASVSASASATAGTDAASDSAATDSDSATTDGPTTGDTDSSTGATVTATESGTGTTGAGTGTTGGPTCGPEFFGFQFIPTTPNVMLVLDKSRSMSNLWDHDADINTAEISRWNSLYNVVQFVTSMFETEMNFGAQLFPSADAYLDEPTNEFSCKMEAMPEVGVGAGTSAAILAAIPDAGDFSISGGTPATQGIANARAHLLAQPADEARAIVLLTDGAANCNPNETPAQTLFAYDSTLPTVVGDTFAIDKIPVYVVGINILDELGTKPATNPYDSLTDVALMGGVPKAGAEPFYNTFNELELGDALDEITGKIECTITLDSEPTYPDEVIVEIEGTDYAQVNDCAAQSGWRYTDPNGPYNAIELCGGACDEFQAKGTVDVIYACP